MRSQKRIEASRLNGQKSRGPRTEAGLRRSSQNSLGHGLSLSISSDPQLSASAERLAQIIAGPCAAPKMLHEARIVAEAQIELRRVRRLRLERYAHPSLVKKPPSLKVLRALIKLVESTGLDEWDQFEIVDQCVEDPLPNIEPPLELKIGAVIASFHSLDRYERRALSKRRFAIRRLQEFDV